MTQLQDFFRDEEYKNIPIKIQKEIMVNKLNNWIDVLGAKERVLQMHTKETQIKIYNKLNVKVKTKKVMFDLSSLTLQEKIEFLALINKTKRSQGELLGVIMGKEVKKEVTEDIEHEVVEDVNVNKIKQVNLPQPEKTRVPNKTLDDLTNKLKATLLKKAEKEFKKAGAKQVAPTVKDLGDE